MFVSLQHQGKVVGFLSVQSYRVNAFNEPDLATLQTAGRPLRRAIARLQAEAALRGSEEDRRKFFALVENSTEYISMADAEGKVFYLNPAGRRMAGIGAGRRPRYRQLAELFDDKNCSTNATLPFRRFLADRHWEGETGCATSRRADARSHVTAFQVEDLEPGHCSAWRPFNATSPRASARRRSCGRVSGASAK